MEIKLNTQIDSVARIAGGVRQAREASPGVETAGFENSQALEARFNQTPPARTEVVERARTLIGDPAYPPRETIDRISNLLAIHLTFATDEA